MSDTFPACDVAVWSGPTVFRFSAMSPIGDEWLSDEVDFPEWGDVAEPRYAMDIIFGMVNDGMLRVALDGQIIASMTER